MYMAEKRVFEGTVYETIELVYISKSGREPDEDYDDYTVEHDRFAGLNGKKVRVTIEVLDDD